MIMWRCASNIASSKNILQSISDMGYKIKDNAKPPQSNDKAVLTEWIRNNIVQNRSQR